MRCDTHTRCAPSSNHTRNQSQGPVRHSLPTAPAECPRCGTPPCGGVAAWRRCWSSLCSRSPVLPLCLSPTRPRQRRFYTRRAATALACVSRQLADSAVCPQLGVDPLALQDSFAALPLHLQRTWTASSAHHKLGDVLADLSRPLEVNVAFDIRLVGFDGDGHGSVALRAADFAPFLAALRLDMNAHDLSGAENGTLVRTLCCRHSAWQQVL
jgi:hypothetical protein